MLQRGDWVVMYQDGIRYLEKAPLHYWMVAVSYKLFGQGAFQTRLPLVLSVVGLVLMVYFFARRWFGETAAFYSGLVICTSVGTWLFTRVMVPEAIFALELTALFYLFLRAWTRHPEPSRRLLGRIRGDGAGRAYAGTDRRALSAGRGLFLYPVHPQLGTLARAANFLQRPDLSGHRRALACDRGTAFARISLVLLHQRAPQARARHPLPAGLRSRPAAAVVGAAPGLVLSLELFHAVRLTRISPSQDLGTNRWSRRSRRGCCSSSGPG